MMAGVVVLPLRNRFRDRKAELSSAFTMTFLSSEPLGHEAPRRNNVFLLKWESQFDCRPATDLALNRD
jgi:hypothetical protein